MSGYNAVLARNTENAPQNIGTYSQTVAFSHYNNLSANCLRTPKQANLWPVAYGSRPANALKTPRPL